MGQVVRLVLVVCPNRYALHNGVYIRYLILLDDANPPHSFWIDDPKEEDCARFLLLAHSDAVSEVFQAPCQWCLARSENPYGTE